MNTKRTDQLVQAAEKTLERGDREMARELMVLAFRQNDAIEALDRLLPRVPNPIPEEAFELDDLQVAQIQRIAAEVSKDHPQLAEQILSRLEITTK